MSIRLMTAIWDRRERLDLAGTDTAILIKMADFAADDGSSVYPSVSLIVKKTGFSERTVHRTIESLLDKNVLLKTSGLQSQTYKTNLYRINAALFYQEEDADEMNRPVTMADRPVTMADRPVTMADRPVTMADRPVTMADRPVTMAPNPSLYNHYTAISRNAPPPSGEDAVPAPNLWWKDSFDEEQDRGEAKPVKPKPTPPHTRGTRIDPGITLTPERRTIAHQQGLHESWVESEFEGFVTYYSNPNLSNSKAFHMNWDAVWRGWCKTAIGYDKFDKKTKPHPTFSEETHSQPPSSPQQVGNSRLQEFLVKYPQAANFAFVDAILIEKSDKITIQHRSKFFSDKIDLCRGDLEHFFGKPVYINIASP